MELTITTAHNDNGIYLYLCNNVEMYNFH